MSELLLVLILVDVLAIAYAAYRDRRFYKLHIEGQGLENKNFRNKIVADFEYNRELIHKIRELEQELSKHKPESEK